MSHRRLLRTLLFLLPYLSNASSPITLIDPSGSLTRSAATTTTTSTSSSSTTLSSNKIIAILTSPGTPSYFPQSSTEGVTLNNDNEGGVSILTSPGATLSGTTSLSRGSGAAAISTFANTIIVTGITTSDLEYGLDDTRHGHTLSGIFRARLAAAASGSSNSSEEEEKNEEDEHGGEEENVESSSSSSKRITLILTVPVAVDEEKVMNDLYAIYLSAKAEVDSDEDLNDLYDVQIAIVDSQESMQKVMNDATQAALQSSTTTKPINIISTLSTIYTKISSSTSEPSPSVAAAILACDDSFALHYRRARSKLSSWKARTKRGLVVDNFGSQSMALLKRTMELYDKDTISASGLVAAAPYRMEMRNKLQGRIEADMKDLFKVQVEILDKLALKNFQSVLLRKYTKSDGNIEAFYNENAVAVRSAAFAFDTAMDELEVPTLGLFKGKASQEVGNKLNAALLSFPDSPAARLKGLKEVKKVVSKNKKPTERSIDLGFDLVAMIRPDGFGNFQGFAGYQLGGNNVIVGVHNDADSPDVIAQFGGVRPPFLRFQPKLKIDVEL